mmetsp:Transcript_3238/g.9885  ORF Transcript_3238/g.9885 Transcript_3238/m.9885 type:complete len:92 (+) Transcript_3238:111-386(+)
MGLPTRIGAMRLKALPKYKPTVKITGMADYRVSPYELELFGDWKHPDVIYRKFKKNVVEHGIYVGPFAVMLVGIVKWANWKHGQYAKEHRF